MIITQEEYKNLLSSYLSECPEASQRASYTLLDAAALKKLFVKYHSCVNDNSVDYVVSKEKVKLKVGALAGASIVNLNYKNLSEEDLSFDYTSNNYIVGVSLDAILPRGKQKWSIYNEIVWKPYAASGHTKDEVSSEVYTVHDSYIKVGVIGIGTMIRYYLTTSRAKLFVNAGIANNFNIINANKAERTNHSYSYTNTFVGKALEHTKGHEPALLVGLGININKLTAEARLEKGSGVSDVIAISTPKTMISFMLAYRFN